MIAFPSKLVVLALAATAVPVASNSFSFNDPSYGNGAVWDVQGLSGIPDTNYLGGIKFTDDGKFVCIVEDAEQGADIYCFDVVRDPNSGAVTDIAQLDPANNVPITLEDLSLSGGDFRQLDVGFTPGPGGYDYVSFFKDEEIGLATWEYAPDGRPTKLTIEHRMDVSGISNSGLYGIEFSNILTDSTTGFGLMFAIGYDEMLALPLLPNGAYFDIDYPNVQYLCSTYEAGVGYAVDYPGDMRIIKSGVYANDLLVMDWDNEKIKMINIDSTTGYPVGFDPAAIDPEAFACPFLDFIDTDTTDPDTQPWGMQFDGATGDFFFTEWSEETGRMYRIRGFPPGYDPAVLNANLQVVFNELFNLVNGASRRLRGDHDDDTATLNKSNNRALQRLRGKPASVARVDDLPSDENQRKLKKPTFVDGKPDFVNAKQAGRGIDEPPKSGQVHPILKNANHKGIDAASGALGDHPVFVLGNVPLSEDTIPSTEVLIDSIQDSSGDLVVSPELKESITILTDPNQQSFDESITSATTDPRLVEKVETIEAVVASIEAPADADDTVKADVEAAKAKIQCLLSIVKQTGSPLDAPSSCTPAAAN